MGIGIWTEIDPGQFYAFIDNTGYSLPAKLLMAPGGFVMIVGFLGCCGTIKESRFLLRVVRVTLTLKCVRVAILTEGRLFQALTARLRNDFH